MNRYRRHVAPIAIWTGLWGLFFLTILLQQQRLPTSDFSEQFLAFASFQADEMRAGRLPLWSPHSYGGVPFVADPQAAVFYLPRWITILLSSGAGLSLYALELEALLHIWLAGVFTYALACHLAGNRWAGLLAAVVFGLGGYLVSYPLLQLAILETIAWLPLLLLLIHLGVHRRSLPWLVGAGGVLALSATAGHPQTLMHVGYTTAVYFLFLTIRARWRWRSVLTFGVAVAATGIAVSAAFWLPVVRYQGLTTRANVGYDFVAHGQPLLHYLQALAPGTLSLWSPEYVGIGGLFLAAFAWAARGEDEKRRVEIVFWSVFVLVAAWIALGDTGILFRLVYAIVPGFSLFRQQERLLGAATLGVALLAAQGLALWLRIEVGRRRYHLRNLGWTFVILFGLTAVVLFAIRDRSVAEWPFILGRQLLVAAGVLALLRWDRWQRAQIVVLIVLLAADLFVATLPGRSLADANPTGYWQQPAWSETIVPDDPGANPARIDTQNLFWANAGEVYGWQDVRGISPLKPQLLADIMQVPRARRWRLLNVTHVLADAPMAEENLTAIREFEQGLIPERPQSGILYEVDNPLPRAWISYAPLFIADKDAALAQLSAPEFDPERQVVLTGPTAENDVPVSPPAAPPVVQVSAPRPGRLHIQAETAVPGYLVISEWHYPGWRAEVDGEPASIQRANVSFQAVWLPAGAHQIDLRFQPVVVLVGSVVSLLSLGLALMLAWRWRPVIVADRERLLPKRPSLAPPAWPSFTRWLQRLGYFWPMVTITFVGFSLRLYRLGVQELRGDEGISYGYAVKPALRIITSLRDLGNPHSPLHYLTMRGWMLLAGESELALRMISLVPGVLTIPLAYQMGRRLYHRRLGMLLAALMAMAQGLVWIGQDARNQYVLAVVFALAATWLLLTAIERQDWFWWLGYTLAAALTVYGHIFGVFGLLAHGAYLLARRSPWRTLLKWTASGMGAALLFAPWLLYSIPTMISVGGHFSRPTSPNLARHLTALGLELSVGTGIEGEVGRWLFLGMLFLALWGLHYLWRQRRATAVFLLTWLLGAALGIYLIRFSRDTFNTYYIDVAAPAWWMLVAAGIVALESRRRSWGAVWSWAGVLGVVAVSFLSLANYYFNPDYYRSLGYRETAAYLETAVAPNDVIVTNYPDASLSYYLRHLETPRTMQPAVYQNLDGRAEENLEELAGTYERLWFLPVRGASWDPDEVAWRWFDYHLLRERDEQVKNITLSAYRPLATADEILTPIERTIAGAMRLQGVYATVDGQPLPLQQEAPLELPAGGTLELSLVWRALAEIPGDYTVFAHLLAEDGRLLAQHDGIPAFGTRPTSSWQPGEQILDKHRITLPENGDVNGRILVGVYDSQTIERQPFANGEDALWLGDFSLVPAD